MHRTIALSSWLALSTVSIAAHEEWNQFLGPESRGVAPDAQALPADLSAETLLWRRAIGPGHSSPCVWGDRIFVTAHAEDRLETICVDRASGDVLWRRAVPGGPVERLHRVNSPAASTPVTDGEHVIASFGSFGIVCYDALGEELWRRELDAPANTFGAAASPILAGGRLIHLRDTNADSVIEALEPATGETIWKQDRSSFASGWSTPTVWSRGGVHELLVYGVGWLTAYDLADGSERWSVPGLTDEPIVTPATGEGLVFVTSYNMKTNPEVIGLPTYADLLEQHDADGDGELSEAESQANESVLSRHDADGEGDHPLRIFQRFLDEDADGKITEVEWGKLVRWVDGFAHANGVLAIRPEGADGSPEIAWQYARGVPECPSPLYLDGRVHLVKNGGIATCLDAASGELRYSERLDSRGPCYASPVAGDGKIYSASARGVVTVFEASDELNVLARNDLGERIMATPALVGGRVYVRTDSHLYAFGTEDPLAGVWKGFAKRDDTMFLGAGLPATLLLTRDREGSLQGAVVVQGQEARITASSFAPDDGRLTLEGAFEDDTLLNVDARLEGGVLAGTVAGLGTDLALEVRRLSPRVLSEPTAPPGPVGEVGPEAWNEDLRFLAAYLPQVHANAFHSRTREEWQRATRDLELQLAELDTLRSTVALARLVATVGDAHTELNWREPPGFDSFPVRFTCFSDGLFVTAVDERWGEALGAPVLRIGTKSAEEAVAAVSTVFAAENESWRRSKAPRLLAVPKLLQALGVLESAASLPIVVRKGAGEELEVIVEASEAGELLLAPDPRYGAPPLWQTRREESYWLTEIEEARAVYVAYNRCAEDPRRPMDEFVDDVLAAVERVSAKRLVIDLRHNSGGNSSVLRRRMERLAAHPKLADPGRIVALIGAATYSSGMMNAHELRTVAGATLVGEPTGGRPNSFGELRSFRLPNSGLQVFYSTKYFRMLDTDPPAVEPDVPVGLASFEHFAGEDPVLARALGL